MILKIIILVLLLILISLLVIFLTCMYVPALKEQTKIKNNLIFSKHQHEFTKLKPLDPANEITHKAYVLCSFQKEFKKEPQIKTIKGQTCSLIASTYGSLNDCKFSCIGLGDCKRVCSQRAIVIKNETAVVTNLCTGCGACVDACPKGLIKLVSLNENLARKCCNTTLDLTTCNTFEQDLTPEWTEKKGFKIWHSCYKLFYRKK